MGRQYVLAIDQGTTSSRAIVFDRDGRAVGSGQKELHAALSQGRLGRARPGGHLARHAGGLPPGDRGGGRRRRPRSPPSASPTSARPPCCGSAAPAAPSTAPSSGRTGAPPRPAAGSWPTGSRSMCAPAPASSSTPTSPAPSSPGCSTTCRARGSAAEHGALAFGTIDSFLLWRLTGGRVHATDATNASRTMLFDIVDPALGRRSCCAALRIPDAVLPEVRDCSGEFGITDPDLFGAAIPILGIAGDQQAATVGQACFEPGMSKSTYGTGCFMLVNTGERLGGLRQPAADHGRLPPGRPNHLRARGQHLRRRRRGAVAARRAARDHPRRRESEALARDLPSTEGVYLVPAFTGPRRAALGSRRARRHPGPDPRQRRRPHRPRRAGGRGLPDRRSRRRVRRRHARWRARRRARHAAGRWRHGRQRLAVPVPGRHAGPAGRAPGGGRDHGPGCGLPRRARRRGLRLAGRGRRRPGAWSGDSSRRWPRASGSGCSTAGVAPWHACGAERIFALQSPTRVACSLANRTAREAGQLAGNEERRAQIVDLVRRQGFVSIEALAQRFAVTPQTVRRDINALCDQAVLQRHHGGAALASSVENIAYLDRQVLCIEEKRRIAQLVAAHIPDHASLFINHRHHHRGGRQGAAAPRRAARDHQQPQRGGPAERQGRLRGDRRRRRGPGARPRHRRRGRRST